jgi:hypothetical protein
VRGPATSPPADRHRATSANCCRHRSTITDRRSITHLSPNQRIIADYRLILEKEGLCIKLLLF